MRLIEEEHQLRLLQVADLGQPLEQFRQQIQQERRVELGCVQQLVGGQDVDDAAPFAVGLDEILDVQCRLAEEFLGALLFQLEQSALDRTDGSRRDVAVLGGEFLGVVADELHHRPQILQVEQQQAVVVGDLEHDRQHALLGVVQVEQPAHQQRPHLRDGGAHRVAHLAEHVPERDREALPRWLVELQILQALGHLGRQRPGGRQAGQIALHVGHEHRHARGGEAFGQDLQRDGLAGTGGPGNQPMPVRQAGQKRDVFVAGACNYERFSHGMVLSGGLAS